MDECKEMLGTKILHFQAGVEPDANPRGIFIELALSPLCGGFSVLIIESVAC